jgi:hypothetical protein
MTEMGQKEEHTTASTVSCEGEVSPKNIEDGWNNRYLDIPARRVEHNKHNVILLSLVLGAPNFMMHCDYRIYHGGDASRSAETNIC